MNEQNKLKSKVDSLIKSVEEIKKISKPVFAFRATCVDFPDDNETFENQRRGGTFFIFSTVDNPEIIFIYPFFHSKNKINIIKYL